MSRIKPVLKDLELLNRKLKEVFDEHRVKFTQVLNTEKDIEIILEIINNKLLEENVKFEYKLSSKGKFVVFKEIDSKLHMVLSKSYLQSYYI